MSAPGWERRGYLAARRLRDALFAPLAALLAGLGVPAAAVSLAGPAAAATLFRTLPARPGWALLGAAVALLADGVDGAVARRAGRASAGGKLLDQACDAASFALVALAIGLPGPARPAAAVAAAVACTVAVASALWVAARRHSDAFRGEPRAGFWAHLPKLPAYLAIGIYLGAATLGERAALPALAGGLDAALWLAAAGGAAVAILLPLSAGART